MESSVSSPEPLLSIIVPACNEEKAVADLVRGIKTLPLPSYELLVIDDGSLDATAKLAREAGAEVISHPYNIGNGAAVKTGIRAARGRVLVFLDGDGQHNPLDIPRLLPFIARYHMVVGARRKSSQMSFHRRLANFIYNRFASLVAGFKIEDLTSGFRIMRREDALRFCDMLPNSFSYPATSTLAFLRSGRAVKYVPIETGPRQGRSKIRPLSDGFEFLMIILKVAMSFSPLRVFVPLSSFLFFLGLLRYAYTYFLTNRFTNMAQLLMNSAVIIFMLGLVAEQIACLRLERGNHLFVPEDEKLYQVFAGGPETGRLPPSSLNTP